MEKKERAAIAEVQHEVTVYKKEQKRKKEHRKGFLFFVIAMAFTVGLQWNNLMEYWQARKPGRVGFKNKVVTRPIKGDRSNREPKPAKMGSPRDAKRNRNKNKNKKQGKKKVVVEKPAVVTTSNAEKKIETMAEADGNPVRWSQTPVCSSANP